MVINVEIEHFTDIFFFFYYSKSIRHHEGPRFVQQGRKNYYNHLLPQIIIINFME